MAMVALASLLVLGVWLCLAVRDARNAAIACASQGHLNQLQLALRCYHDAYSSFPPAYLVDQRGMPVHSWRVLILPFIEQKPLYNAYRFDEPWDGPNNRKLADRMPQIFQMPSEPTSTCMTNIVTIVGPETAFPGSNSTRLEDFADGLDNTILLAEITRSDICWLEPRDLRVEEMSFRANDSSKPSISSARRRGPYVVFADSIHTHQLSPSLHLETLKALTTINGGEKMYMGEIDELGLASLGDSPGTDEKIEQLSFDGLKALWLSRSDITDAALERLAAAPSLSELHLRSTRITDAGLSVVAGFVDLVHLDVSGTRITDSGLELLKGLTQLQTVNLGNTSVTEEGVKGLEEALPKCTIQY